MQDREDSQDARLNARPLIHYRTRGGTAEGWGSVLRLAAFASYCHGENDAESTFFVEGPATVVAYLQERGFAVVRLETGITPEEEARVLAEHPHAEYAFVELTDITPDRQAVQRAHADRLVVFDDLCAQIYDADLVVCGQGLPNHANRHLSSARTRFLVGYDHFLCRPEFLPYADRERSYRDQLERVLVTLGGGRYDVGYTKAALALAQVQEERGTPLQTTFVLGYDEREELRDELRVILPDAEILGGVHTFDQLLWGSDLVIGSAGYTKLEAAITRTPQIMMSMQWHQLPLASIFAACTGVTDVGHVAYVQPGWLATQVRALESVDERRELGESMRSVVDGRGFERVHAAVFETSEEDSCSETAA